MYTPLRSGIFLAPFHAKADNPTLAMEREGSSPKLPRLMLAESEGEPG